MFDAHAAAPAPEEWRRFLDGLRRWGRGRIQISVDVREAGAIVGSLDADYVSLIVVDEG
jgi:hypothetical protein